jgi:hypothetical protein
MLLIRKQLGTYCLRNEYCILTVSSVVVAMVENTDCVVAFGCKIPKEFDEPRGIVYIELWSG